MDALGLWSASPIFGVGYEQYMKHNWMTAHNSYALALAEQGLPGTFLWLMVMWFAVKVPFLALRTYGGRSGVEIVQIWARALIASMLGLCVGILFLSFYTHFVLWTFLGIISAFHLSILNHDPGWARRVETRVLDIALVGLGTALLPFGMKIVFMVLG
jgi:O-antigen ligase